MRIGVPKESYAGERRVAMVPASLAALQKLGATVLVESGAGLAAGFTDASYTEKGATLAASREAVFADAEIVLRVRGLSGAAADDVKLLRKGQVLVGLLEPLTQPARPGPRRARRHRLRDRARPAHHARPVDGRALVHGHGRRLQGGAARRGPPAAVFPLLMTAGGTLAPRACSCWGPASPACRRSPPHAAWARSSRPSTCARRSRSRWRAWAPSSSSCRWSRRRPGQGRLREGHGRGVLPQAARDVAEGRGRRTS